MQQVKVALFTGASCVGKSTITSALAAQHGWPAFDNDDEICGRIFHFFREPILRHSIGDLSSWQHLREHYDFEHLFRVYHRDWFARAGMPASFLACGWIYCFREWREQTYHAFQQLPGFHFHYKVFVLDLNSDDYVKRFQSAQQERFIPVNSLLNQTVVCQETHAREYYDDFLNHQLQLPDQIEADFEIVHTDQQLAQTVAEYFADS